jgi:hypothetical protein
MIGRSKTWLWWLAGFLCALVFGRGGMAAEAQTAPERGAPDDRKVVVDARQPFTAEERAKAEKLIDAYLAPPPNLTAEQKAEIEKLMADLAAADPQKREAASAALVKLGPAALAPLSEAAKSKDAEVAARAAAAAKLITDQAEAANIRQLNEVYYAAKSVLEFRIAEANKTSGSTGSMAAEMEKAGKADEAAKYRQKAQAAEAVAKALDRLKSQLKRPPERTCYMIYQLELVKPQSALDLFERQARIDALEHAGKISSAVAAKVRQAIACDRALGSPDRAGEEARAWQ